MRSFYFLLVICSVIVLIAGISIANDVSNGFVYDAKKSRDPFLPLVTAEGKIAAAYSAIESINDVKIQGIAFDPDGDSVVIINGLVLKNKDKFDNIEVILIEPNKVTLLFNEQEHVIQIQEE